MANWELENFVKECRAAAIPDNAIRKKLLAVGWPESEIRSVLGNSSADPGAKKSSLKLIIILILSILGLATIIFAGYYMMAMKNDTGSGPEQEAVNAQIEASQTTSENNPENRTAENPAIEEMIDPVPPEPVFVCTTEDLNTAQKPINIGTPKEKITSTMNLFINALEQSSQCLALSLFSEREKYSETIGAIFQTGENTTLASDFKNFILPVNLNSRNPSTLKATVKVKDENGAEANRDIFFAPQASGEYLISQFVIQNK